MDFNNLREFLTGLEEKNGILYDSKGRKRGTFDPNTLQISVNRKYCIVESNWIWIQQQNNDRIPIRFAVKDMENGEKIFESLGIPECIEFLEKYYPEYQNPISYWS